MTLAQSAVVIGDDGLTRDCFSRAEIAISFNAADKDDVEICSRALESPNLSPSDRAATLVNRGILLLASGDQEAAHRSYSKALAIADDQGETHVNIGNVYMYQQRYREAVDVYTRGIDLIQRRRHVAYLNRGLAYEYLKDYDAARLDYEQALALSPEWIRAKKMLARVNVHLSRQDDSGAVSD